VIDREGLDRRLELARSSFSPPPAAKARVRAGLSSGPAQHRSGLERATGITKPKVALLMGLSLAVGYLLGRSAGDDPIADKPPGAAIPAPAVNDLGAANPLGAAGSSPGSRAAEPPAGALLDPLSPARASPGRAPPLPSPPASAAPKPSAAIARRASAGATARDLRGELSLLSRAERALRVKEVALAVSFLDELDREYPRSSLLEERTAARLIARCLMEQSLIEQGNNEQSDLRRPSSSGPRATAERFLEEHHDSVYTDRIRRACELESTAPGESREESSAREHYGPKEDHHE
jgi:hypothetical protein